VVIFHRYAKIEKCYQGDITSAANPVLWYRNDAIILRQQENAVSAGIHNMQAVKRELLFPSSITSCIGSSRRRRDFIIYIKRLFLIPNCRFFPKVCFWR
jgi:hypothetical protein